MSSIYPTINATIVVNKTEIIFTSNIKKYSKISLITIPINNTGPAGLGTFGFPGL
jgi:hypothetical protein